MTRFRMWTDNQGNPIQAIRLGTTVRLAVGASSARVALPTGAEIVRVVFVDIVPAADANNSCAIAFGGDSVAAVLATDALLLPGEYIFKVDPSTETYMAAIGQGSSQGLISITAITDV